MAEEICVAGKRPANELLDTNTNKNESLSKLAKHEDSDDGDDEKGSGKFQKRMVALQFGYVGTGYAGLQK
jgi:hypothetical protein